MELITMYKGNDVVDNNCEHEISPLFRDYDTIVGYCTRCGQPIELSIEHIEEAFND